MSHYINSFLIEPVVRQARRFSRPSDEDRDSSPHPDSRQLLPGDPDQLRPQSGQNVVWGSRRWRSTRERGGSHVPITPDPNDASRQPGTSLDEDATSSDRPENLISDDQVSSNPVYGVPESLRSTTSSLSTSAQMAAEPSSPGVQASVGTTGQRSHITERHYTEGGEGQLPADDGMGLMRKQIVAIQRTNSSSAEKARMVHELMTEQYNSSQSSLQASHNFRARSPASLVSHERPFTPGSLHSMENHSIRCTSPPTSLSSVAGASNPFNLTTEDLTPTFYQKPTPAQANAVPGDRSTDRLSDDSGEEPKPLGCRHYKRNIKLQCSACCRWYTCRFCHDEVEDHSLNRRETKNMLCMLCGCAQSASEACSQCGERSARYYCSVCKLWDDDPGKSIYHCNDCGICRIGQGLGKDFYHCKVRERSPRRDFAKLRANS